MNRMRLGSPSAWPNPAAFRPTDKVDAADHPRENSPNTFHRGRPGPIADSVVKLFIIGMPRSGTSWLGKIFDRHPRVLYRFEPDTVDRRDGPPYMCPTAEVPKHLESARIYLDRMARVRTTKSVGSLPYFKKSYRSAPLDDLRLGIIYGLKAAQRLNVLPKLCQNVTIPDLIDRGRPEALVMKSIESVGRVNLYRAAWPESRAIVIIRHPCGQIASTVEGIKRHKFAGSPIFEDQGLLTALSHSEQAKRRGLTRDRLAAMDPMERLAWMWAIPNEKALEDIASDPNARPMRYRDLCAAPMSEAHELFRFANISWDPLVEEFIRVSTDPHHAASDRYYSVFRDPELSVDRWKSILSADDVATIRKTVEDTAPGQMFGYS
jgi:hypothetical protein